MRKPVILLQSQTFLKRPDSDFQHLVSPPPPRAMSLRYLQSTSSCDIHAAASESHENRFRAEASVVMELVELTRLVSQDV
eukprot:766915-Hanusia_phi.AAC.8